VIQENLPQKTFFLDNFEGFFAAVISAHLSVFTYGDSGVFALLVQDISLQFN